MKKKLTTKRFCEMLTWQDQLTIDLILTEAHAYFLRYEVKILALKYLKDIKYNNLSIVEIYQIAYNQLIEKNAKK
jgi:hypothetical protein